MRNTESVQGYVRTFIWFVVFGLLFWIFVWGDFSTGIEKGLFDVALSTWIFMVLKITFFVIIANLLAGIFYILPEWERLAILRLGRFNAIKGPGVFVIPPFVYSEGGRVDLRLFTLDLEPTSSLTSDNVPVIITAFIDIVVNDPETALIKVGNFEKSVKIAAYEAIKNTIGGLELKMLLSERDKIAEEMQIDIDKSAESYGVDIRNVRLTDITTPEGLMEELAVIARAERAATAKGIQGKAEKLLAKDLAEAAETLTETAGGMKLREIQLMGMMAKEESSMIIVYPHGELGASVVAAASAGSQTTKMHKHPSEG
jgi:regulator of protease activity HflC (stomatin/prohibitin superfamily)